MNTKFNDLFKCDIVESDNDLTIKISKEEYERFCQNFDNFLTIVQAAKYNRFVEDQATKLLVYCKFFNQ